MIYELEKLYLKTQVVEGKKLGVQAQVLCKQSFHQTEYPIFSFEFGSNKPEDPLLFILGGVHGIERVGAKLAWSLLKTTWDRLEWDNSLKDLLKKIRIIFVPLLNPFGYEKLKRCNPNDVDLMRNSPINAIDKAPFLLGGHNFSKKIPWYRGNTSELEIEVNGLSKFFLEKSSKSHHVIALDFHSGFGMKDRLWFPYAYKKAPFENIEHLYLFTNLFEQMYPFHVYQIEPQSKGYLLNGDLWDYLYIEYKKINNDGIFIPLTLEMGSWSWVKKNPTQIFYREGPFNPIKTHRLHRTYRRHQILFDFALRALYSCDNWTNNSLNQLETIREKAFKRWY